MKLEELRLGDIVVVDHNALLNDGRPKVAYVVMYNEDRGKVMIAFDGNCNNEEHPSGWYEVTTSVTGELPYGTIAVYRPKWFGNTFRGDFDNEKYYECLYHASDDEEV